jgi:Flp pilus assembly protein TadD
MALVALLGTAFASAGDGDKKGDKKEAEAEMEWGYKAARRGYWQEALIRFQHANILTPNQPRILNNIAVAQEANGLYEDALLSYQTGLAIAPDSDALRRNYMRFQEFYNTYIAKPEEGTEQDSEEQEADDAQENG